MLICYFFTELKWKALNAALFNHNMANGVNVMNADRHTGVFTLNSVKMCFYWQHSADLHTNKHKVHNQKKPVSTFWGLRMSRHLFN